MPSGELVPRHFHVIEIGKITKHFVDCGGVVRTEEMVNFQLWTAEDYNHRLSPKKLLEIIALSEQCFEMKDEEIEVEYQAETIGKFGLDFDGAHFLLTNKQTDCLAKDNCGIPLEKESPQMLSFKKENCCPPNGNCC